MLLQNSEKMQKKFPPYCLPGAITMLGEAGDICGIFGETVRTVVKNGNCQWQEAVYMESTHLQLNHKMNEYEEKCYQFIISSVVICTPLSVVFSEPQNKKNLDFKKALEHQQCGETERSNSLDHAE
jgi:hypothetical protein